jgi:putative membrane protein
MNLFQSGLSTLSEQQERPESQKPSQPQQGDDATVKAASAISQAVLHRQLTSDEKRVAGPMVHYAFGSVVGGLYGAMAEVVPVTAKAWGVPFGAAVWLGADEIGVPAAGLSQSPDKVPVTTHASALAAHLVYGATADAVRRVVRLALIGRAPNRKR